MKSERTSNWLAGCALAVLVLLLIFGFVGIQGYRYFRQIQGTFSKARDSSLTVQLQLGSIEDFCPSPDGSISPESIRKFLRARKSILEASAELRNRIEQIDAKLAEVGTSDGSFLRLLPLISVGARTIPQLIRYQSSLNQALLETGLGPGEYHYIYILAYFSWLKRPVEDGPAFLAVDEHDEVIMETEGSVSERRRAYMVNRTRRLIRLILRRGLSSCGQLEPAWRKAISAELVALEDDPGRIPWQENLPLQVVESFEPFQQELGKAYVAVLNPFEFRNEWSTRRR